MSESNKKPTPKPKQPAPKKQPPKEPLKKGTVREDRLFSGPGTSVKPKEPTTDD